MHGMKAPQHRNRMHQTMRDVSGCIDQQKLQAKQKNFGQRSPT
jgi:hypothetical protein